MAYNLKKEHVTNWDARNVDEEDDSPISERTSVASTNDPISPTKPPTPSPLPPAKEPHSLRYHYNDMPENGVPLAVQYKRMKAEEKKRLKNIRKAPPGQGRLAPVPESKPSEMSENFYPYWHYYKIQNPDWQLRHRQTADGQLVPYDSFDPSKYTHEPALSVSSIQPTPRSDKAQRRKEKATEKQYIPLKDPDRDSMPVPPRRSRRRREQRTEPTWNDPYTQSITDSSMTVEKKKKHRHHHHHHQTNPSPPARHHHHHHQTKPSPPAVEPSSSPHHHHHHHHQTKPSPPAVEPSSSPHHHHHHHHHLPSLEYLNSEFQVSDHSYKRLERSPFFQPLQGTNSSPPPMIYNQSSYLPPIGHIRTNPLIHYGTLSQHTITRDWSEPVNDQKVYRADPQTRFYDRYLNNIIDKRLTAL